MKKEEISNINQNVQITYEKGYVAFLDVLGFKEMVFSEELDKINLYIDSIEKAINYLKSIQVKQELEIGYIVISDSIIIYIKHGANRAENIERLRNLCIAIGFLQVTLAVKGIWLRGAISSDDVYFNSEKNQVIGKAYIEAYLLEEKFVSNPQIILDNSIIKKLEFNSSKDLIDVINEKENGYLQYDNCGKTILYEWTEESNLEKDFIQKEFPLFIDYLALLFNPSMKTDISNRKREIICMLIESIENIIYSNVTFYEKHKWTANYILSIIDKGPELEIKGMQSIFDGFSSLDEIKKLLRKL